MVNKGAHKLPVGYTMGGKWKVRAKLGEGGFGAVYKVINVETQSTVEYAMKVETVDEGEPTLKMEAAVLKAFWRQQPSPKHVCEYVESGGTETIVYIVMELVGPSVADLRRACPNNPFSHNTATRIESQSLEAIEDLHRIGFVHRDIKPENLAMGRKGRNTRTVYLLDYGLARHCICPNGRVRLPRTTAGFRGTVRYASINTHLRRELGRHDDLWSWLYMSSSSIEETRPGKTRATRTRRDNSPNPK